MWGMSKSDEKGEGKKRRIEENKCILIFIGFVNAENMIEGIFKDYDFD